MCIRDRDNPSYPTPIIAGNVSFYNESKNGPIPPSPIVSCLGRLKDIDYVLSMDFQSSGSDILMVGERKDELGGSIYYQLLGELGANVPKPDFVEVRSQIFAITDCAEGGLILSCHDISDGGIATSIAEMTFRKNIGCLVNIPGDLQAHKILFSETGGFVIETKKENTENVIKVFKAHGSKASKIGETGSEYIQLNGTIKVKVREARHRWENGLREKL